MTFKTNENPETEENEGDLQENAIALMRLQDQEFLLQNEAEKLEKTAEKLQQEAGGDDQAIKMSEELHQQEALALKQKEKIHNLADQIRKDPSKKIPASVIAALKMDTSKIISNGDSAVVEAHGVEAQVDAEHAAHVAHNTKPKEAQCEKKKSSKEMRPKEKISEKSVAMSHPKSKQAAPHHEHTEFSIPKAKQVIKENLLGMDKHIEPLLHFAPGAIAVKLGHAVLNPTETFDKVISRCKKGGSALAQSISGFMDDMGGRISHLNPFWSEEDDKKQVAAQLVQEPTPAERKQVKEKAKKQADQVKKPFVGVLMPQSRSELLAPSSVMSVLLQQNEPLLDS